MCGSMGTGLIRGGDMYGGMVIGVGLVRVVCGSGVIGTGLSGGIIGTGDTGDDININNNASGLEYNPGRLF